MESSSCIVVEFINPRSVGDACWCISSRPTSGRSRPCPWAGGVGCLPHQWWVSRAIMEAYPANIGCRIHYIYTRMYVYIYTCTYTYTHTHIHIHIHIQIQIQIQIHVYKCVYVYVYIYIYIHTYIHIYIYTYTCKYLYTHIYIHIQYTMENIYAVHLEIILLIFLKFCCRILGFDLK